MRYLNYKVILLITLISSIHLGQSSKVISKEYPNLNYFTLKCYQTKNTRDCLIALKYLELLQRDASDRNNYRCQTHALGLGSDMIRLLLRDGNVKHLRKRLSSLDNICKPN